MPLSPNYRASSSAFSRTPINLRPSSRGTEDAVFTPDLAALISASYVILQKLNPKSEWAVASVESCIWFSNSHSYMSSAIDLKRARKEPASVARLLLGRRYLDK